MRKRNLYLVVFLVFAMIASACSSSESGDSSTISTEATTTSAGETTTSATVPPTTPPEPITVTFWNYWDGKNGEVMDALAAQYSAETENVTVETVFFGWGDLLPKLQAAVAGGDAPDMAAGDLVWMPQLSRSGKLVELDPYIQAAGTDLEDFFPALLDVNEYDGSLFGLPLSTNNLELLYNTELFEAAGLDPATPPTTWDELRTMSATCADESAGVSGMEVFTEPGEGLTWQYQVYLWQAGGEFLSEDNTKAAFNSPEGAQALQYLVDLLHTDGSAAVAPWGQFGQGNACMVMDGSWMVGIWAPDPPFAFETATMPYPTSGGPATNMGGEMAFLFTSDEAKQQAAFDFLSWLSSTDVQIGWDMETGFMPIRKSVAESSSYLDFIATSEPRYLPYVENQKYAHNRPPIPQYPEVSDVFSRELEKALLGAATVEEALAAAETAVNGILDAG